MHPAVMKYCLLSIALLLVQVCYSQNDSTANDSSRIVIPKFDLHFGEINAPSSDFLSDASNHISTIVGNDSVFVFQHSRNTIFLAIGKDSSFIKANLKLPHSLNPEKVKVHYQFEFDSLGTDQQYLIVRWMLVNYREHRTHSGSSEFMCHETVNEYEVVENGLTIISLFSRQILFQGVAEVNMKESQTKNPGSSKKSLKNQTITKVQHWPGSNYLNIFNHGYDEFNYWALYQDLTLGFYQIIDDQYVLVRIR